MDLLPGKKTGAGAEKNQEQRLYVDRIMAESDVKKIAFPFIAVTGQTDAPGHLP